MPATIIQTVSGAYYRPESLLSIDRNAKTVKGQKLGFMTGILYLAPATLSGRQVCPMAAVAQCEAACLNTAGRGAMGKIQLSRINKTQYFHRDRDAFMAHIADDIRRLVFKARKAGFTPLVRLNGTSDIRFELIPVTVGGIEYANIMAAFPDVQFYDYTKISNRHSLPDNYDLTFSYSGVAAYQPHVAKAVAAGMRVAVVFRKQADIPARFLGLECVGGDDSDIRHLDPRGVAVALYAKGKARQDQTGFVVDVGRRIIPLQLAA